MIRVLQAVEALIRDAYQLIGLIAVLGKCSDAMVHADAHTHLKVCDGFFENGSDTAAQRPGLSGIGLREQQGEFVAANAKGGV